MSGLIAAGVTALVALFFTPLFRNLPEATLAAIVIVAVSGMVKVRDFRWLHKVNKVDFGLALVAFLAVMTFEEVAVSQHLQASLNTLNDATRADMS
jgi:MFS superfamily sulfate permease-like transporter